MAHSQSAAMSTTSPASPTYCRPQHLDRERLRRLLARDEFENVCFHEAVVVVEARAAPAFKLLAVTSDALLLFPLGSGGGGSASPAGLSSMEGANTRVGLDDIVRVDRASPTQTKLRGAMLHGNSELFEIATRTQRQIYVATFEPNSRAFFFVARAVRLEFQKLILSADLSFPTSAQHDDAGDLHDLLQDLLAELSDCDDCTKRSGLLDELAAAATSNHTLQKLCFEDQTALRSCVVATIEDGDDSNDSDGITYGLCPFLVHEISLLSWRPEAGETLLEYELSLLGLLRRLLFGGHWVAARLRFFLQTPLETWLRVATHVPILLAKAARTDAYRVARDELIDLQIALLLELQLLQEEARLQDATGVRRDAAARTLLTGGAYDDWVARIFKRVAILLSRTMVELPKAEQSHARGSRWSLALWRATKVVCRLLRVASANDSSHLVTMLLRRRRDYLDLYLRNPRFGRALAASSVVHLLEVADDMLEILDMLS